MKTLSIDIETYSDVPLQKTGAYRYVESPNFEILLFAYSADNQPVQVIDPACGEQIPKEVFLALEDEFVIKWAWALLLFLLARDLRTCPTDKKLMKLTLEQKLAHGGHPVLRWMMDNIYIRTAPAGNIKADKEKSTEKIAGAVATIMGLDRAIRCGNNTGASVYDDRGILFI